MSARSHASFYQACLFFFHPPVMVQVFRAAIARPDEVEVVSWRVRWRRPAKRAQLAG